MTLGAWVSGCCKVLFIANNTSMRDGVLGTHVVLCYRTTSFIASWWAEYFGGRTQGKGVETLQTCSAWGRGIDGCSYLRVHKCIRVSAAHGIRDYYREVCILIMRYDYREGKEGV